MGRERGESLLSSGRERKSLLSVGRERGRESLLSSGGGEGERVCFRAEEEKESLLSSGGGERESAFERRRERESAFERLRLVGWSMAVSLKRWRTSPTSSRRVPSEPSAYRSCFAVRTHTDHVRCGVQPIIVRVEFDSYFCWYVDWCFCGRLDMIF